MNAAYIRIALALIGRGVGVPIPEDIPLLTAGYLCAVNVCEIKWIVPLAWVSVIMADILSFSAGRFFRWHLSKHSLLRIVERSRFAAE